MKDFNNILMQCKIGANTPLLLNDKCIGIINSIDSNGNVLGKIFSKNLVVEVIKTENERFEIVSINIQTEKQKDI